MKAIRKQHEPKFWREFRQQFRPESLKRKGNAYGAGGMPTQELRKALAREQGYLCCYCQDRISATEAGMKVEHWQTQSEHPESQIDYENLLGACPGGNGGPAEGQHCDTARKDQKLHTHPAQDPGCSRRFRYYSDGTITSEEASAQQDIETLRLNIEKLRLRRKAILDALRSWLEKEYRGRSAPPEVLRQKAEEWARRYPDQSDEEEEKHRPFCQVAIYWLEKQARGRG